MRRTTARRKKIMRVLLAWAGSGFFAGGLTCRRQATPGQSAPEKTSPEQSPTNNVRPTINWKRFEFTCEGGTKITLYLHNNTAKIRTKEHLYLMRQTSTADGNRYSDGKVLWWGKGDTGFLQEDFPDGDGKMLVK